MFLYILSFNISTYFNISVYIWGYVHNINVNISFLSDLKNNLYLYFTMYFREQLKAPRSLSPINQQRNDIVMRIILDCIVSYRCFNERYNVILF